MVSDSPHTDSIKALEDILMGLSGLRIGVAVSGGVDSRLLAHTLQRLKVPFMAVHATGPHLSPQETAHARRWLAGRGIRHLCVRFNPLDIPGAAENGRERCYHCKHALFSGIRGIMGDDACLLEGAHASDATTYRPGLKALGELGIRSPFAEAGLTKADLRRLAEATGLDWPDQPSRPCLMTRFAYDVAPDVPTLERLGRAEDSLSDMGLAGFRLRLPSAGQPLLQVPIAQKSLAQNALDTVKSLLSAEGFDSVAIDYTESISGYHDRADGTA